MAATASDPSDREPDVTRIGSVTVAGGQNSNFWRGKRAKIRCKIKRNFKI
jgi:hypothetical protein